MIIFIYSFIIILLIFTTAGLLWFGLRHPRLKENFKTIKKGFSAGLKSSGLTVPKNNYQSELWKWETMNAEDVCEDCLERSSWPPMDIADWMKEGMPRTPESETKCGENCRCQLVRYYPGVSSNKKYFNQP